MFHMNLFGSLKYVKGVYILNYLEDNKKYVSHVSLIITKKIFFERIQFSFPCKEGHPDSLILYKYNYQIETYYKIQ